MNDPHIGEAAELYALGEIDALQRAYVDAHVATCPDCLRRVGEAEETILALERAHRTVAIDGPPPVFARRIAPRWLTAAGLAAAVLVGFILPHPQPAQSPATVALLHSHFNHAQFVGGGPLAKVLYSRDRSWYYIVVEGEHTYTVVGANGGAELPLGATSSSHGGTSELFVRPGARFERIELREGSRTIETAQIR